MKEKHKEGKRKERGKEEMNNVTHKQSILEK